MSEDPVVVLVTTPADRASEIASHLVQNRLAACVNIIPDIRSVFRWQENIEEDRECLLVIKSTRQSFEAVSLAVRENHPYTVPEIIALPIVDGYDGYLNWVRENVGSKAPEEVK
ncbi:MAG: divalent-cation tolerance protein CutA [Deltaproteobacteria bacterium]|nr:divalent-cation tolerance protein CutA [Deltaproteobacteria bacterium]